VMRDAQRLVVDDADYASEIGDGAAWIAQGHLDRAGLEARVDAYAWEVAAGRKPGRTAPGERIVALMQGMAIGDVAFAAHALREARARGLGVVAGLD
jgi:ornithine cyclodeaminase/alanine dehydrogenase-like protein (mu-crystallin family)